MSAGPESAERRRLSEAAAKVADWRRKRYEVLAPAILALKPRHAGLEHAAQQELPELALDELRQARAVAGLRHRAQEGLQVFGDHLVEHGVLGVTGAIHGRATSHVPG